MLPFKRAVPSLHSLTHLAPSTRPSLRTQTPPLAAIRIATMSSSTEGKKKNIYFGPFEVTSQVFIKTKHCFGLVNLKPLLPGHILICPLKPHLRLTDVPAEEMADLFSTVQTAQNLLAKVYFPPPSSSSSSKPSSNDVQSTSNNILSGSFNVAIQDGPAAGQTVPHLHVHIIPRLPTAEAPSDEIYVRLNNEDGNVGGKQWDVMKRPGEEGSGALPKIEDEDRKPRDLGVMEEEVGRYQGVLREMGVEIGM